jgi:ubiquinone/menaquinone biosynthesis C-methylase UbiE
MIGMELQFSWLLLILLFLVCINYISLITYDQLEKRNTLSTVENFEDKVVIAKNEENETYLNNDELYDSFYASVYDQLVQSSVRTQAEIGLLLHVWTASGTPVDKMTFLDVGCGTGIAVAALAKMNAARVVGIDKSAAMINQAKTVTIPAAMITDDQRKRIELKEADILNPSALGGAEVTHATLFYFTVYYLRDMEAAFRNLYLWVKPGGKLAIEVVNKHKFDPMLESAAPWMAFSLQKYSKERVTKSKVTFNKFEYEAHFDLEDPAAEFREIFRFKDGKVRRQRHKLQMPDIKDIVKTAQIAGWKYDNNIDLTPIGFEYAYLLMFTHP